MQPTITRKKEKAFMQEISVMVTSNSDWIPEITEQFISSIFSLDSQVNLIIEATSNQIQWHIATLRDHDTLVAQTVYASYPNARLETKDKNKTAVGYRLYNFQAGSPFIAPLKYASDFKKTDPLASIVAAMSQLKENEGVIYEVALYPVMRDVYEVGEEAITESLTKWWQLLTPEGLLRGAIRKGMGTDKIPQFAPHIQRVVEQKLYTHLRETIIHLKIKADSKQRADQIADGFGAAFALYEREGFNFLIPGKGDYYPLVLSVPEVAALWHFPTKHCQSPNVRLASGTQAPFQAGLQSNQKSVLLGHNLYQGRSSEVKLGYDDRETHVNMFGRPGVGKSNLMHHMIHQDIAAGHGVGVIDPHGDLIYDILNRSVPVEREEDIVLLDIKDKDYFIGLNLLAKPDSEEIEDVASEALAVVRKIFEDQWSAARMERVFKATFSALVEAGDYTLMDVPWFLMDSDFRYMLLKRLTDPVALNYWHNIYEPLKIGLKMDIAQPIINRLSKFYENKTMRRMVGQTGCLDFRSIIEERKIFLANISGLGNIETETLGALLMSRFQLAALSRGDMPKEERHPFYLFVDEVQSFITTSLPKVFSEARKFSLSLTVANQFTSQLAGKTLDSVLGTSGATIIFGVGPKDAPVLAPYVRPQFLADDLIAIDNYNAIARIRSGKKVLPAFNMETLAPIEESKRADGDNNANGETGQITRIRALSRKKYARPKEEIDQEILARYQKVTASEEEDIDNDYLG